MKRPQRPVAALKPRVSALAKARPLPAVGPSWGLGLFFLKPEAQLAQTQGAISMFYLLVPEALASVPYGIVLVRVRVTENYE